MFNALAANPNPGLCFAFSPFGGGAGEIKGEIIRLFAGEIN